MDEQQRHVVAASDGAQIVLRRYRHASAPRLLLCHGNGFAIDGYRAFWSQLIARYDLVLFDLRNHGLNPLHDIVGHTIDRMARDHVAVLSACADVFGARPTAGVFHSISGVAAVMACRDHGARWDALGLIDPPLVAAESHPVGQRSRKLDGVLAQFARSRPERFANVEALEEALLALIARKWVEGAAMDMARATTRPCPQGGVELCCPGEYEARIYEQNAATPSFDALAGLRQPTFIIGADPDGERPSPPALVGPLAAAAYGLGYDSIPGTRHVLQIEKPRETLAILETQLARAGFPPAPAARDA